MNSPTKLLTPFQNYLYSQENSNIGTTTAFEKTEIYKLMSFKHVFWCHIHYVLNPYVKLIIFKYNGCFCTLTTIMHFCDTIHDAVRPQTFPPFRFKGVTFI